MTTCLLLLVNTLNLNFKVETETIVKLSDSHFQGSMGTFVFKLNWLEMSCSILSLLFSSSQMFPLGLWVHGLGLIQLIHSLLYIIKCKTALCKNCNSVEDFGSSYSSKIMPWPVFSFLVDARRCYFICTFPHIHNFFQDRAAWGCSC